MPIQNEIFLRRRSHICLPVADGSAPAPRNYLSSLLSNLETCGYAFSETLMDACWALSLKQLTVLHRELTQAVERSVGAHQTHRAMYRNFPLQVMTMQESELYLNALAHYWTGGRYFPESDWEEERLPLFYGVDPAVIDLGTPEEFEQLFAQIAGANASLSDQDKEDLTWFVETYGDEIARLLPESIPQKENIAFLAGLLSVYTDCAPAFIAKFCHTATDVLRLAVAMSGGDVSLATSTRFRSFRRAERDLLLGLLNGHPNLLEDMRRWRGRWLRLGERLHPGEYEKRYPRAAEAFRLLHERSLPERFNSRIETALAAGQVKAAVDQLRTRPGDFARRLDHLCRLEPEAAETIAAVFGEVIDRVSTPVLLQVRQHFQERNRIRSLRVFFPKGNLAKAYAIHDSLPELSVPACERIVALCEQALISRFRALPPLGKVYVDTGLAHYMMPFAVRSAAKTLRTIARGSRLPLPPDCKVLRFFLWWMNGRQRTDIDLSATLFDADFRYKDVVSYYNLTRYGGCHSGDIVDAPDGASEFIDITLEKVREHDCRYIVMTVTSYTEQPYCDLPECFAGWMARQDAQSGEIYEPRTVQDRIDLTADTRVAIPLIIDIEAGEVIWCDMALRHEPRWPNNVHSNLLGLALTLRAFTQLNKPNLYDLFRLHALARGELVETPEEAETTFTVQDGLPFRSEEIASTYML